MFSVNREPLVQLAVDPKLLPLNLIFSTNENSGNESARLRLKYIADSMTSPTNSGVIYVNGQTAVGRFNDALKFCRSLESALQIVQKRAQTVRGHSRIAKSGFNSSSAKKD